MKTKVLQDAELVRESLICLRNELIQNSDSVSGRVAEIVMKINSCLYSSYPPVYTKES